MANPSYTSACAGARRRSVEVPVSRPIRPPKISGTAVAFFRNDTVNLLNLHYGIHTLALSGGGTFFAAYLLRSGVPAPAVLAALAAILAGRFVIRPFVLLPARRFGLKPLVIAGTVMTGLQYPLLAEVRGVGWELVALCAITSAGDTVYWMCYHAYFASLGDADHRGHQLGAREAIAAIVGIIGPLATGWTLTTLGPKVAFDATAVVLLLGALPILGTRNVPVADTAPGAFRAAALGLLMFMADGWIAAGFFFVWQMALFLALGESFTAYGGAMALAALVGAVSGLSGMAPPEFSGVIFQRLTRYGDVRLHGPGGAVSQMSGARRARRLAAVA